MCNLLHAKTKMLSAKIESGQRAELRGWQKVFAWRVMAQQFVVWRVIEPQLSAWRGTGQHNVRDLLFCKPVMRDLQDFLLEFRDNWTPSDLEGYQSSKVNGVLTKVHKTWQPCHCFLAFSVLCWPMLDLWKNFVYQLVVHKIFPRSSQRPKRIQKPRYILAVHKGIGQSFDVNTAHVLKNKKGDIDVYSIRT